MARPQPPAKIADGPLSAGVGFRASLSPEASGSAPRSSSSGRGASDADPATEAPGGRRGSGGSPETTSSASAGEQPPIVLDGVVPLGTGVDLGRTFQLHSNPYATKTIFLDFDGFDISSTPWENGGALSLGAFFSSFDTTALTRIQRIWQRVAEDFSPFDINVTTEDPGSDALRRSGSGDTRWGTIMGAPFLGSDENLTQWSKGQYATANNTKDDLAVITGGNGFSSATALGGLSFSSFGVIERNTDIDMFRFDTGAGRVNFDKDRELDTLYVDQLAFSTASTASGSGRKALEEDPIIGSASGDGGCCEASTGGLEDPHHGEEHHGESGMHFLPLEVEMAPLAQSLAGSDDADSSLSESDPLALWHAAPASLA